MKFQKLTLFLISVLGYLFSYSQSFDLKSNTLNNGSETATSTNFQLNGAIGEISAGPSISANFQLNTGSISNRVAATVEPGLIAHYPLDGNLLDASGNGYHGEETGTLELHPDVAGLADRAFYFDGLETYVSHTFDAPQQFTGVTLSAWVYLSDPNVTGVYQNIVALESSTAIIQLGYADNSYFVFYNDGSSTEEFTFGTPTTGWHHIAVTWNGTTVNTFVDGVALGPLTASTTILSDIDIISLGADQIFSGEHLDGVLDEVKIFDYGMTVEDAQNLYYSYPNPPAIPQNITAKVIGPNAIEVSWTDGPDETFYEVYWDDSDSDFGSIDLEADETSYTITGLTTDVEYYIEVVAWNDYTGNEFLNSYSYDFIYQTPVDQGPIQAQAIPEYFTLDETVTIQFYPQLSYPVGELEEATQIYMYAGLIAPEDVESGSWTNTVGNWGEDDGLGEVVLNEGVWEITINPRSYFGVSDDFVAAEIGMVFSNADGTLIGKAADLEDIKIDVFDPTTIAPIGGFLSTDANTDVYIQDNSTFTPENIQLENLTAFTLEALVNFGDANPAIDSFEDLITRGFDDGSTYNPLHGAIYYASDDITAYPTGLITTEISAIETPYYITPETGVDVTGIGAGDSYSNGTWAQIALVFSTPSTGNFELYINGIHQGFVDILDPTFGNGNILKIGQFVGGVDELRIWNDIRSQDEIRAGIKTEIDPTASNLIGYWKMNAITNDGIDDIIADETASGNDFIVGNATITQLPDLDMISLGLNPKSIAQDETLSISYTIENIGAADADAFDLEFFLSDDNVFDGGDVALTDANVTFSSGLAMGESVFNIVQATIPAATADNDYFVIAVIDDAGAVQEEIETNNTATSVLNVNASNVNNVTTSITLDSYSFPENADLGTVVGAIFYDDPDDDLFDIALVDGDGATDNGLFQIVGGELITNDVRDFELDATLYSVRIQVDDNRGGVYSEAIEITLSDVNEAPTDITITNNTITEGAEYFESIVGMLETVDQDASDSHSYAILVEDNANASFLIDGNDNLLITVNDPALTDEFTLTIQSTDEGGLTTSNEILIVVGPAALPPNGLLLSNNTINENHGAEATIGQFFATDEDSDTFTYALADGGTDNAEFSVSSSGVLTQNNEGLAVGTYSIRVSAFDETDLSITLNFNVEVISNSVTLSIPIGGAQSDYRIIGVPFTNSNVGNVFSGLSNENRGSEWRMFGYNNGSTSEVTSASSNLAQGNGYWFITTIEQNIELPAGNLNTNLIIQKSLTEGWNLIGNPYLKPLNWGNILDFNGNPGSVGTDIYVYNGGWSIRSNNTLGVMEGAFVEVTGTSAGSIDFYPSTASVGTARVTPNSRTTTSYFDNSGAWQLYLNLESNGMSSNISGIGLNEVSVDEKDMLDKTAPPTPAIFTPLQLTEKTTGLTKNIKAVNKSVLWDFALTGPKESTTISWDQQIASLTDEPLIIALLPQGEMYDMGSVDEITFTPEKNQSVMVVYGNELPKELLYNAITAYPNPADQEVNFRFFVDQEGAIPATVELYNLSGKQLGSISQMASGGQWNEINYKVGTQDLLKSGIYLFKIKYSDFESAMKKLIIK